MTDLQPGAAVEVRNRFDGGWSKGFVVDAVLDDGRIRVRRLSDGEVLPVLLLEADVRRERKRQTWWV